MARLHMYIKLIKKKSRSVQTYVQWMFLRWMLKWKLCLLAVHNYIKDFMMSSVWLKGRIDLYVWWVIHTTHTHTHPHNIWCGCGWISVSHNMHTRSIKCMYMCLKWTGYIHTRMYGMYLYIYRSWQGVCCFQPDDV